MHAIRKQGELRTKYEMVVKIKHVTLAVKALESIKKYAQMQIQAKEMNAKALQHYYQALQLRALKALCVFRSRESLVRQFRERSLINQTRRALISWENLLQVRLWRRDAFSTFTSHY